jgi:hypothetical protein
VWTEYRRELCLNDWQRISAPTNDEIIAVCLCLMGLRENPRPVTSLVVNRTPEREVRIADVPNTNLVCVLYAIYDDSQTIVYMMIEGVAP